MHRRTLCGLGVAAASVLLLTGTMVLWAGASGVCETGPDCVTPPPHKDGFKGWPLLGNDRVIYFDGVDGNTQSAMKDVVKEYNAYLMEIGADWRFTYGRPEDDAEAVKASAAASGIVVKVGHIEGDAGGTSFTGVDANSATVRSSFTFPFNDPGKYDRYALGFFDAVKKVMRHEMGHTFGLGDVPWDKNEACGGQRLGASIMNQLCGVNDADGAMATARTACDKAALKVFVPVGLEGGPDYEEVWPGGSRSGAMVCYVVMAVSDWYNCEPGQSVAMGTCSHLYNTERFVGEFCVPTAHYSSPPSSVERSWLERGAVIRNCQGYSEIGPSPELHSDACLSYCRSQNANACEWNQATGECWAKFGTGCSVETGHTGWWAQVLEGSAPNPPSPPTPPPSGMQANSAVRSCQGYSDLGSTYKTSAAECLSHCQANGANACEWEEISGACWVEFGTGCQVEGGFGGWWAAVLSGSGPPDPPPPPVDPTAMQGGAAVRGCQGYSDLGATYKASAAECLSYCQANGANACEWEESSGACWVEFGTGCQVEGGFGGWWAAVLSGPGSRPMPMMALAALRPRSPFARVVFGGVTPSGSAGGGSGGTPTRPGGGTGCAAVEPLTAGSGLTVRRGGGVPRSGPREAGAPGEPRRGPSVP